MPRGRKNDTSAETPKVKINKESLRQAAQLMGYVRPYKSWFALGLVFITLSTASTMTYPFLLKELIDSAKGLHQLQFLPSPGAIAATMFALLALQMIFSYGRIYCFTRVGENALADLRKDIYNRLISMPMQFFASRRVGELNSRISTDVSQIQDMVTSILAELLRGILTMIIGLLLILFISPKLTLLMLSIIPVVAIFAVIFGKKIRSLSKQAQDKLADSNTIVQESLQGISSVKAFNNERFEQKRYATALHQVVGIAVSNAKARGLFVSFLLFALFGAIVLVVWYGTVLMQQNELNFGDLTAFVVYTAFVGGTIAGFADLYSQVQKTLGATQRVREILQEPVEQNILTEAVTLTTGNSLSGAVRFENVHFNYPSRPDVEVLKGLSFNARPGEQIALIGESGAGKTTIASLLLHFYTPTSGQIWFGDKEINEIPIDALRAQMAIVPQDVFLFGGSIYDNIAYGKPNASKAEVEEAARQAHAHNFIETFPEKYNTLVGERGIQLSGGQRQRIAIARAILKNPSILILDEATSSLDAESEYQVQQALGNLLRNRTSFVIAHRLSTIKNADNILVLQQGRIVESGTHESLLKHVDGMYSNLISMQLQ